MNAGGREGHKAMTAMRPGRPEAMKAIRPGRLQHDGPEAMTAMKAMKAGGHEGLEAIKAAGHEGRRP